MKVFEIIIISISIAMDAFTVSICKGLSIKKNIWKKAVVIALYFGLSQAVMPMIGYFLATAFSEFVVNIDHWIAFILLSIIGMNMIKESANTQILKENDCINFKTMIGLSIATSIDALAVGITFAFLRINMMLAISIIGTVAFLLSILGVKIGTRFGDKLQNKSGFIGGIVLILIGLKILLEHLKII